MPPQATAPPPKLKRKMVYFLKLARVALVKEDVRKLVGTAGAGQGCSALWVLAAARPKQPHPADVVVDVWPLPWLQVVSGELSDALLDQLSALSSEVFLPLISNNNLPMAAAPPAAVKGVAEGMHKFVASGGRAGGAEVVRQPHHACLTTLRHSAQRARLLATAPTPPHPPAPMPPPCCAVHVTAGQLKNQTVLPLPPISDAELEARPVPADVQRLLEAALVTWTRQIKAVLSQEPEQAANSADGAQAGPLAELDYWADRATQLGGIWQQLGQPSMQRAVAALEAGASTYLPAFVRLCHEVDAAHRVAAESSRYLQPLRKPLDRLHTMDDFPALASLFKPILHTLLLIWQHSQHYSSAPRLVSLIRHICNDLIAQARRFCPGAVAASWCRLS